MSYHKTKRIVKRVMVCLLLLVMSPFLYRGVLEGIPYLNAAAYEMAVWSAGLTLPEGGKGLLAQQLESSVPEDSSGEPKQTIPESPGYSNGSSSNSSDESSDIPSSEESQDLPQRAADAGDIIRRTYKGTANSTHFQLSGGGWVKNLTSHSAAESLQQISQGPAFKIENTGEPQVLIMHTHTTESYERFSLDWYDRTYNSRTTDLNYNVARVGDEIEKQLKAAGIGVIHDTTLHDYPNFPGCYDRSAVTVKEYLKKYPSIKIVLDVHRDAIEQKDGTRTAPVANINGKNAAQIMIISGCDDGTMGYPNYFNNLKFAALVQDQMETDYPGLARPLLFDYRKYNQHLTNGSILLEMGGHANSMEEVIYAGELIGKSLANALAKIKA